MALRVCYASHDENGSALAGLVLFFPVATVTISEAFSIDLNHCGARTELRSELLLDSQYLWGSTKLSPCFIVYFLDLDLSAQH